ncbi:MAG: DUF2924 domain-containing protein [Pseudomonadota bacterium]|nr:DUF2924 domain-containing protein [Pseudomonadota bacterium]
MQIEVDFEVWKALTLRRAAESVTYNDVLRDLLELGPWAAKEAPTRGSIVAQGQGYFAVGRHLPHGTKLRARYKGRLYTGEVSDGRIITEGRTFKSLSAAARGITDTNVNGLRFWHAKRPGEEEWTLVAGLRKDVS